MKEDPNDTFNALMREIQGMTPTPSSPSGKTWVDYQVAYFTANSLIDRAKERYGPRWPALQDLVTDNLACTPLDKDSESAFWQACTDAEDILKMKGN